MTATNTEDKILEAYNFLDSTEVVIVLLLNVISLWHAKSHMTFWLLLQNNGLLLTAYGLLLGLRFGVHAKYYLMSGLAALLTACICIGEIIINHGSWLTSDLFLWLPMYMWYLIAFAFFMSSFLYGIFKRASFTAYSGDNPAWYQWLVNILLVLFIIASLLNVYLALH